MKFITITDDIWENSYSLEKLESFSYNIKNEFFELFINKNYYYSEINLLRYIDFLNFLKEERGSFNFERSKKSFSDLCSKHVSENEKTIL